MLRGVAACIQQGAATQIGVHADVVGRVGQGEAKAGLHRTHLAHRAIVQQGQQVARLRLKPPRVGLQQHHAVLALSGKHGLRLGQAQRQRLLAQDVLALRRRLDSPFGVQAVGQGDVDGVNGRVGQQGLVAAVVARNAVGCGIGGSGVGVAAGHGIDADFTALADIACELFGDIGAA